MYIYIILHHILYVLHIYVHNLHRHNYVRNSHLILLWDIHVFHTTMICCSVGAMCVLKLLCAAALLCALALSLLLRRCAVVRFHLHRCAVAPLRRCLVALAPVRCCAAALLLGFTSAGPLLRRCAVVWLQLRRCVAALLWRCHAAPVRCCAAALLFGFTCAGALLRRCAVVWLQLRRCAAAPLRCRLDAVAPDSARVYLAAPLVGSDTCNCVFFTLALPVASIGGLMTFHNYYWLFIVAGAVARGLCVKAFFFLSFFVLVGVGWGNNVHVRLLSDVMLRWGSVLGQQIIP